MVELIPNFLSSSECNKLINFYKINQNENFRYNKSFPLNLTEIINNHVIDNEQHYIINCTKQKIDNILSLKTNVPFKLYNAEIVKWPILSDMHYHHDANGTEFSCIIYLNDNYIGGNTMINDKIIKKKKGSLLIMKNSDKILHKVTKNIFGVRYTFPLWYGNQHYFLSKNT